MVNTPDKEFQSVEVIDPSTGHPRNCFLVKYEKRRHRTMRIGTLEYFRNIEANQGDQFDGRVEGVEFAPDKDTPITTAELLAISGGSLAVVARDGIQFGASGRYSDDRPRRCHNVYVYCCSMEFGVFPSRERMDHFGATEYFVIDDTRGLRDMVAVELQKHARSADGTQFSPSRHHVKSWEAPVRYRSRKKAAIELPINNLDFFVYQKDPKFLVEQEYRFVWVFFDRETDKPIDVDPNPIDIPFGTTVGTAHVKFDQDALIT